MLKKGLFLFVISLAVVLISCQSSHHNEMEAKYKAAYYSVIKIWDGGNVDELGNYIAEDAIDHQLDPSVTSKTGLEGVKDIFRYYHKIFPDMKTTIYSVAVSGDTLFSYNSSTGTTSEPFMGMPAGQQHTMNGIDVVVFKGDKMSEHWGFMDMGDVMKMMQSMMPDTTKMKEM